jgi:hypothetical protein
VTPEQAATLWAVAGIVTDPANVIQPARVEDVVVHEVRLLLVRGIS